MRGNRGNCKAGSCDNQTQRWLEHWQLKSGGPCIQLLIVTGLSLYFSALTSSNQSFTYCNSLLDILVQPNLFTVAYIHPHQTTSWFAVLTNLQKHKLAHPANCIDLFFLPAGDLVGGVLGVDEIQRGCRFCTVCGVSECNDIHSNHQPLFGNTRVHDKHSPHQVYGEIKYSQCYCIICDECYDFNDIHPSPLPPTPSFDNPMTYTAYTESIGGSSIHIVIKKSIKHYYIHWMLYNEYQIYDRCHIPRKPSGVEINKQSS